MNTRKYSEVIKKIQEDKKTLEFIPTGFYKLDEFLDGGFMRKELIVLGAPTGKGKSFVAGQIFQNIAKKGFKSVFFSLEISSEMVAARLLGSKANIKPTRIIAGFLTPEENNAKIEANAEIEVFDEFMYFYDDLYEYEKIEKEIKDGLYDFIVIDFIQNIIVTKGDEYERLSFIALSLQKLAKETNSCILILSQLSNMVSREKRDDVVEYRGSGTIATVCDLGFFMERGEQIGDENIFTIKLRKNRRGVSGIGFDFIFKQPGGRIVGK